MTTTSVSFVSSVPREGEHAAAQPLPGLGGRVGEGARPPRHERRDQQVADGRRARRPITLHHHPPARGPPLHEHQQVPRQIRHAQQGAVAEEKRGRETDFWGCLV